MLNELTILFPEVPRESLESAKARFYAVEFGRGLMLMEEGEQDGAILFLLEGHVAICTGDFEIATAGPGGLVGEIGLFGGSLRIASVRAIQTCVVVVLDRRDYEVLLEQGNPVAWAVERAALDQIAGRLREADARLSALCVKGDGPALLVEAQPSAVRRVIALEVLRRSSVFAGGAAALEEIASRMTVWRYAEGSILCAQGASGQDMFVLGEGFVDVLVDTEQGGAEWVATLETGDVFGMASVVQDRPRMATCRARGEVVVLRMDRAACQRLTASASVAGSVFRTALIRALGDQIAYANAQFSQLTLERKRRTAGLLARLGIEAHGRHVLLPVSRGSMS
jgi:CRP-like cAMP-binding protein